MTRSFPTVEEAVAIHDDLLAKFGGSTGLLDMSGVRVSTPAPADGVYYDGLIQEAAALMVEPRREPSLTWTATSEWPFSSQTPSCV